MNPIKGILLKLSAVTLFVIMAALIKAASDSVPTGERVFFRSFCAIPVILIWLLHRGELRTGLKTNNPMVHVWRGLIGTTAMASYFLSLGYLPFPEVTAIGFAAPLMTVIFAAMLLGEDVRIFRLSAVFVGLIGVSIMIYPRLTLFSQDVIQTTAAVGVIAALLGAVFRALAQIHIRKMVATEQTSAVVFYFSLTASGLSLLTLPFGWVWPGPTDLALLISAGLIGGVAQILLTSGYRFAPASVLAPFDYASMILALLVGYFIFDETATKTMLGGAALVIAGGMAIIYREHRLGLAKRNSQEKSRMVP